MREPRSSAIPSSTGSTLDEVCYDARPSRSCDSSRYAADDSCICGAGPHHHPASRREGKSVEAVRCWNGAGNLGRNATKFANGEEPAFFFAITLHTLELAGPSAASWSKPLILYSVVPDESDDDDLHVKALNRRTQEAAANIMQNPALNGKTIVMVWEHKHPPMPSSRRSTRARPSRCASCSSSMCCLACHRPGPATITTTFGSSIVRRTPTYRPTSPWQSSVIPISPCGK